MKKSLTTALAILTLGGASVALATSPTNLKGTATGAHADLSKAFHSTSAKGDGSPSFLIPANQTTSLGADIGYDYWPGAQFPEQNSVPGAAALNMPLDGMIMYSQYSFDTLGVVKHQVNKKFAVYAKGGAAVVNQELQQAVASPSAPGKYDTNKLSANSRLQPKIATGFGYDINSTVKFTTEFSHTYGDELRLNHTHAETNMVDTSKIHSDDAVLVGMNFSF